MRKIIITSLLFLTIFRSYAQDKTQFQQLNIGQTTQIHSSILNEKRTINIYLPDGYNASDTVRYPVIYILDGGIHEDFVHLSGLVQYSTQPWIGRFPQSIVVGIENTNRKRDFTFAVNNLDFLSKIGFKKEDMPYYGGSAKYIDFIERELQPFINDYFKTTSERTVIGESLGGLLATEIFVKHRELFNNYVIISPSLWWGNEKLLTELTEQKLGSQPAKVYIGAPSKDEMPIMYDDALQLSKEVKNHGGANVKVYFDYLPRETHATVIHQAVYNAFGLLYPKSAK